MKASLEFKIRHSEVQMQRCIDALSMFKRKFNGGDQTFTKEKQDEILLKWSNAIADHKNEIEKLTKQFN